MYRRQFCELVTGQLRCKWEAPAVRQELSDHIQDHMDALMAEGMDRDQAEEAAVAAMGDPEEVGKALDALYSPVAGWLLRAFGWLSNLALAALCLGIFYGLVTDSASWFHHFSTNIHILTEPQVVEHWLQDQEDGPLVAAGATLTAFYPDAAARTTDYHLSIPCAVRFDMEDSAPVLDALLKVVHPSPWLRHPELEGWISAYDDLGHLVPSREAAVAETQRPYVGAPHVASKRLSYARYLSPFVTYYFIRVYDLDPDATRLTFTYDRFGRQELLLPISLEGGGPA